MKLRHTLSFILLVFLMLYLISIIFPKDGIKISEDISLKFVTVEELFFPEKVAYADISDILKSNIDIDTLASPTLIPAVLTADTLSDEIMGIDGKALSSSVHMLEFPADNASVLSSFFTALDGLQKNNKVIRVLHYGDSQIEGDRMTAFIRNKLQGKFGGSGVGLIPAIPPFNLSYSIVHQPSDNWERYTLNGPADPRVTHKRFGAMGAFSRFAPIQNDSIINDSIIYKASIVFEKSKIGYASASKFKKCKLYYGNNKKQVIVRLFLGGELIRRDTLRPTPGFKVKKWEFESPLEEITFTFEGKDSPDIYGISLDDTRGVAVDNIAWRGSSGTLFTSMDKELLRLMYANLNPELMILQFGGNVMPYIKSEQECKNYGDWFCSQLKTIKAMKPGVALIVIGPSDMSYKDKENYVTYEYLENVRDALKEAAFKAGAAYWDMYEAMGGKNSMPSWVSADPPLAAKDYTHFSGEGTKVIANMFYNALNYHYHEHKASGKQKQAAPIKKKAI